MNIDKVLPLWFKYRSREWEGAGVGLIENKLYQIYKLSPSASFTDSTIPSIRWFRIFDEDGTWRSISLDFIAKNLDINEPQPIPNKIFTLEEMLLETSKEEND